MVLIPAPVAFVESIVAFFFLWVRGIRIVAADKATVTLAGVAPEFIEALRVYRLEKGRQPDGPAAEAGAPTTPSPDDPETDVNRWAATLAPLSDELRSALALADEASRRIGQGYLGTEHLLLGLATAVPSVSAFVFKTLGLDPSLLEVAVCRAAGPPREVMFDCALPPTSIARTVLRHAAEEARVLNHPCVGTEHLLLGLLRAPECQAAQILRGYGVDRDSVQKVLADGSAGISLPPSAK